MCALASIQCFNREQIHFFVWFFIVLFGCVCVYEETVYTGNLSIDSPNVLAL